MPRIDAPHRTLAALVLGVFTLGGCLGFDCDCPALAPQRAAEGILRPRDATGAFSTTERLVVDRAAGVVTVTSMRDGHVVVERWRIVQSTSQY
ncbi:MAG: hypothetical protein Q8S73_25300 [Deltaproteobacteria bacterium]|nr:hypothetical protein [Myxococcales bacterium]MDP3217453.1 hypothetical protein [Deltaproteobacteria bacterium]